MFSTVSTGAFLTTVCLAHLVLGALMGVLVHAFGADMLSLWRVGRALCH
ncbi:hypothetical protein [Mycobacterium canetti]|nr:hypothetical protein [Mycobacterium canetti]CCK59736.1 Conserved exported protein of unknown function [Mycobacterium canettii CIPT 140070010]